MEPLSTLDVEPGSPERTSPTFVRTIDRRTVHRQALSEVFLTDAVRHEQRRVVVGAQLPSSHAYFGDHLEAGTVDILLVLECCRQAGTLAAHTMLDVPGDASFLVLSWDVDLTPAATAGTTGATSTTAPGELTIAMDLADVLDGPGGARGATLRSTLALDGQDIGTAVIDVRYASPAHVHTVRSNHRRGPLTWSNELPREPVGIPVPPGVVGRTDARNVVILDAHDAAGDVVATLGVRSDHRSYFDHAHDHYPAMILTEAARQIAVLLMHRRDPRSQLPLCAVAFRSTFEQFAELDSPVTVQASHRPDDRGRRGAAEIVDVRFFQNGEVVAATSVDLLEVSTDEGAR